VHDARRVEGDIDSFISVQRVRLLRRGMDEVQDASITLHQPASAFKDVRIGHREGA
jgi:hypothetical protein